MTPSRTRNICVTALAIASVLAAIAVLATFDSKTDAQLRKSAMTTAPGPEAAAPPAPAPAERPRLTWPDGLIAFFPMNNLQGESFTSTTGQDDFTAQLFAGTAELDREVHGPFGPSIYFDGKTTYTIGGIEPAADAIGALDVARSTGHYTIITWVRDMGGSTDMEFRAGSHIEDGPRTARQYGLYFNGHGYGGHRRVTPHIANQDGPTPGYPYNVDFGATARQVGTGGWHMEAGTYDGTKMVGYLDGVPDSFPDFTEREPEPGYTAQREHISKNPYYNDKGINNSTTKKVFSIGGSLIGDTPYVPVNETKGWIGGIAVFDRALSDTEIKKIRLATLPMGQPILDFDFYSTRTGELPVQELGWKSYGGPGVFDASDYVQDNSYHFVAPTKTSASLVREGGSFPALTFFPLTAFRADEATRVTFKMTSAGRRTSQRLAVRFGQQWYVTAATFNPRSTTNDPADWTEATQVQVGLSRGEGWRSLTFDPDAGELRLGAASRPSGSVTALGFFSSSADGPVRLKHLRLWR